MSIAISSSERGGSLVRPVRFVPSVDWLHTHASFAYGPPELDSAIAIPRQDLGNYNTEWVAYIGSNNEAYLVKKDINGLWNEIHIPLLSLISSVRKISLEFSPDGRPILGYILDDNSLGIWWINPDTGLRQLLSLIPSAEEMLMSVENKDDPAATDVFLWYFVSGSLFLRKYSERFATEHGPFVSGVSNPVILQAGMNHRYGYQIDYRSQV